MDYGHTQSQPNAPKALDMSGMLDIRESQRLKTQAPTNDLNLNNWGQPSNQPSNQPSDRPPLDGQEIVELPESERAPLGVPHDHETATEAATKAVTETAISQGTPHPITSLELGQIVPLEMPPTSATAREAIPDRSIRTEGDHLSGAAIEAIDQIKAKLGQTGDVSSFYDEARAMTSANLENSYGRKIGEH